MVAPLSLLTVWRSKEITFRPRALQLSKLTNNVSGHRNMPDKLIRSLSRRKLYMTKLTR